MAITFTGPDAFKFFGFTPKATAVLQANPFYLVILILVLIGCIGIGVLAYVIHIITNRPYAKPKAKKGEKKAGGK